MSKRAYRNVLPMTAAGSSIATAYNEAGAAYLAYADGGADQLFAFDGQYGYGDRCIWNGIEAELVRLRASGAHSVRILDLGCGPGTWLRRIVTRARDLDFSTIVARGFDIADEQVERARSLSVNLATLEGVTLEFEIGNITERFEEPDGSVDICLCLCGVLNHLPSTAISGVLAEVARVTRDRFITTVRAIGSTPTVYVGEIEQARHFQQDNHHDWLEVELQTGRHVSFPSHLFGAGELRSQLSPRFDIKDICGLDLFHGRFARDPRWNPEMPADAHFAEELDRLERLYCREPEFIDHATHLLVVAKAKPSA